MASGKFQPGEENLKVKEYFIYLYFIFLYNYCTEQKVISQDLKCESRENCTNLKNDYNLLLSKRKHIIQLYIFITKYKVQHTLKLKLHSFIFNSLILCFNLKYNFNFLKIYLKL